MTHKDFFNEEIYMIEKSIEKGLSYKDIYLIPNKGIVKSRSECDTSVTFGPKTFSMPVVPANMRSVISEELCAVYASHELFYVMHRFDVDLVKFYDYMKSKNLYVSISIGVKKNDIKELAYLIQTGRIPEYITIDIAHGHSDVVERVIKFIKDLTPTSFLIAGNVATQQAVYDLEFWGADATKCGIANGAACRTYNATGFGTPQYTTNMKCASIAKKPFIADGSIKDIGDFAKAIQSGATMVMAGSLFAGVEESPAKTVEINGLKFKEYFGSASSYNKDNNTRYIEGDLIKIPHVGDLKSLLLRIHDGLASSISYAGGTTLKDLLNVSAGSW